MDDSISRQSAIDVLSFGKEVLNRVLDDTDVVGAEREKYSWGLGLIESTIKDLKELPPAERKKGEWIKATGMMPPEFHGHHCCSECGNFANMKPPFGNREDLSSFCPNCGAEMEKGETYE